MSAQPPATILFVDDDPDGRRAFGRLFRDAGFAVLEAAGGADALRLAGDGPDLVVLDVSLPDINGFEVCRRLKTQPSTRWLPVLHLSAVYVDSGDRAQALESGADAYLVKPVEPCELLATVRALLRIRAAEEAARGAAQQWRSTFDALHDAVCLLGPDGSVRRCNRALADLVARPFAAIVGQPLARLLREGLGLEHDPPLGRPGHDAGRHTHELALGPRCFRASVDPIHDAGGAGSVCILTDVSGEKELEEQLRQGQRLEALGRLAGGVAHDFNNLLTVILGNAALLLEALPAQEPGHAMVRSVERAAWRAAELTRRIGQQHQAWFDCRNRVPAGAVASSNLDGG